MIELISNSELDIKARLNWQLFENYLSSAVEVVEDKSLMGQLYTLRTGIVTWLH